ENLLSNWNNVTTAAYINNQGGAERSLLRISSIHMAGTLNNYSPALLSHSLPGQPPGPNGLAFEWKHFSKLGYSKEVINTLLVFCKKSTFSAYYGIWWEASSPPKKPKCLIFAFLQEVLDKGLSLSSLKLQAAAFTAI
uniref:Uncharacterized protein n=1 Tax=Latimeria chalumnae TaxID=7897 RepID=H3AP31_LATCH